MNQRILVTGFKPFLDHSTNSSEEVIKLLNHEDIIKLVLPVEFDRAFFQIQNALQTYKPDRVLMLGLASGREKISLEKIGLNWNESDRPDASEHIVEMGLIDKENSDLALMTLFPVNQLYQFHKNLNHPVEISFSAGTYVCNNLYYKVLYRYPEIQPLFIHIPSEKIMDIQIQVEIIEKTIDFVKNN